MPHRRSIFRSNSRDQLEGSFPSLSLPLRPSSTDLPFLSRPTETRSPPSLVRRQGRLPQDLCRRQRRDRRSCFPRSRGRRLGDHPPSDQEGFGRGDRDTYQAHDEHGSDPVVEERKCPESREGGQGEGGGGEGLESRWVRFLFHSGSFYILHRIVVRIFSQKVVALRGKRRTPTSRNPTRRDRKSKEGKRNLCIVKSKASQCS